METTKAGQSAPLFWAAAQTCPKGVALWNPAGLCPDLPEALPLDSAKGAQPLWNPILFQDGGFGRAAGLYCGAGRER